MHNIPCHSAVFKQLCRPITEAYALCHSAAWTNDIQN